MLRHRGHVARLYPTTVQASSSTVRRIPPEHFGTCCMSGTPGATVVASARRPSKAEMDRQIREARTHPLRGYEWLCNAPRTIYSTGSEGVPPCVGSVLQGSAGRPRFKQRSRSMAVDNPQASDLRIVRLNRRWGEVTVQGVGRVRFRWTRPLPGVSGSPGRITGARLVKDALGWHIVFRIEETHERGCAEPWPSDWG
jgi:putative transposase